MNDILLFVKSLIRKKIISQKTILKAHFIFINDIAILIIIKQNFFMQKFDFLLL